MKSSEDSQAAEAMIASLAPNVGERKNQPAGCITDLCPEKLDIGGTKSGCTN